MLIRTFQKKRNVKKTILIIIIMVFWIFLVSKITTSIYNKITAPKIISAEESKIGNEVTIKWEIKVENNFPIYTHSISNISQKFYIKSASINLNKFLWATNEIVGKVTDNYKWIPVIDVDAIKDINQWLIIKDNIFFFVKDLLYLDFTNQNQLSAYKKDKEVTINYNDEKLFSIERFLCSRVLKNKNCMYLIDDYGQTQKETFDSYRWYTFYKHGTWLRTVFDGDMFGYIFKNIEDDTIIDISSMIRIIDKYFIISNKGQQIKDACQTKDGNMQHINYSKIRHENDPNTITIIVDGDISKNKVISCEVTFDMRNQWKIKKTKVSEK